MAKRDWVQILTEAAESLLGFQNLNKSGNIVSQIQTHIQEKYQEHYFNLNLHINKNLSDEEVISLIAERSENRDKSAPQVARQLPMFNKLNPQAGFECTLATAMLRLALSDAGFQTRSLLLRRHFVAMRELENGLVKIYDAATRITINGQTHGFTETFSSNEVLHKKEVLFDGTRKGYVFSIKTKREIKNTEMFSKKEGQFHTKQFFAYEPEILVDLAVVLENLSQFKNQKDADSVNLCNDYPILRKLEYPEIKSTFRLFDAYDYLG